MGSSHAHTAFPRAERRPRQKLEEAVPSYVTSSNRPVPPPHLGPPAHLAPRDHGSLPRGRCCSSPCPVTSVRSPVSHIPGTEPFTRWGLGTGIFSHWTSPPLCLMPGPRTQHRIPSPANNSRVTVSSFSPSRQIFPSLTSSLAFYLEQRGATTHGKEDSRHSMVTDKLVEEALRGTRVYFLKICFY